MEESGLIFDAAIFSLYADVVMNFAKLGALDSFIGVVAVCAGGICAGGISLS